MLLHIYMFVVGFLLTPISVWFGYKNSLPLHYYLLPVLGIAITSGYFWVLERTKTLVSVIVYVIKAYLRLTKQCKVYIRIGCRSVLWPIVQSQLPDQINAESVVLVFEEPTAIEYDDTGKTGVVLRYGGFVRNTNPKVTVTTYGTMFLRGKRVGYATVTLKPENKE